MTDLSPGQQLGAYEIQAEIGRGGMGVVYRAIQPALGRLVAIKVLPATLALDPELVERFLREARAMAALDHPGIVTIYDVAGVEGSYFFAMQYVQGRSVGDILAEEGVLLPATAVGITSQVASALGYAHQLGTIHRDIKPGNIMIDAAGRVVLMDFGIARAATESRITRTGTVIGSPEFMSPEQVAARPVDHRSDLYALGIVLYQMLTGEVPYEGDTAVSIAYQHVHEPVKSPRLVNPVVPPELDLIACKLMLKDPEDRYQTAEELMGALQMVPLGVGTPVPGATRVTGVVQQTPLPGTPIPMAAPVMVATPVPQGPAPQGPVEEPPAGRNRLVLGLGLALSVVGLALIVALWGYIGREPSQPESLGGGGGPSGAAAPPPASMDDSPLAEEAVIVPDLGPVPESESLPVEPPIIEETVLAPAEGMVAMVTVRSNVFGDLVILDGTEVGPTPQELVVDPGTHRVELRKPGCPTTSQEFQAVAGGNATLFLKMDCPGVGGGAVATVQKLFEEGRYDEALDGCFAELERNPGNRGMSELCERIEATLSVLQGGQTVQPNLDMARELFNAGRYDEALGLCDEVLRDSPGHPEATELKEAIEQTRQLLEGSSEKKSKK